MKAPGWIASLVLLVLHSPAAADTFVGYRPGYYRLAAEAAFVGRVHVNAVAPVSETDSKCGLVYDVTVSESISGAAPGTQLRFVSDPSLRDTTKDGDAFAVLFPHALSGDQSPRCWHEAAPLFAATHPASVVPFDAKGGQMLGGEFLPVGPDNILTGLQFAGIEIELDGKSRRFASWELVRAYARQQPAVRKVWRNGMPKFPSEPGPLPTQ
jgi:hypothetical protein